MLAENLLPASNDREKHLAELGFRRGCKNPLHKAPRTKGFLFYF